MTLGNFISIPLPFLVWDDECVNLMMPCFPIVGIVVGFVWWGTTELLIFTGIHTALAAAIFTLVSLFTAGLIHLDGYMDTSDAVLSRRDLEERIRILKDPHTGSFAVIMVVALFVMQFAAAYAFIDNAKNTLLLIVIAVISRCGSAFCSLVLKPAPHSGYVNMYRQNSNKLHTAVIVFIAADAIIFAGLIYGFKGLIVAGAGLIGYVIAISYVYKDLQGVSGDLVGFSLVISELCGLIALAAVG